uniref:RING-type domain-containing protein n=1 Tax=viral metagenome TaxID=1070528 RepID=A0A6C0H895_9ZZZZ
MSDNSSHNGSDCPICFETFSNDATILKCKHVFHSDCLVKFLEYKSAKQNGWGHFLCPICRRICCNITQEILYETYLKHKKNYKETKKQARRARSQLRMWNIKHRILKYFKKYNEKEAYDIIIKDETLTYEMHKLEAIVRQNREKYFKMKVLYETKCCTMCF